MDKLGVVDQFFYKADQYGVASMVMGGVSILAPAGKGFRIAQCYRNTCNRSALGWADPS